MPTSRFIQIHALVSYSAALLNRDDSGLAKRLPFGGSTRTRISSQCLKRHWRKTEDEWALSKIGPEMAVRSRKIPEERLRPDLDRAEAGTSDVRAAVIDAFARLLYTPKAKKAPEIKDRQALLIGEPELKYLSEKAKEIAETATSAKDSCQRTWLRPRATAGALSLAGSPRLRRAH